MPKIIRDNEIVQDNWTILDKDSTELSETTQTFVPLSLLLSQPSILDDSNEIGVWLDSDEEPSVLEPHLGKLTAIAINFPKFADGRGYSYSRILRDKLGYKGEIRAIGDVLHDQLFYMKRCGFNAFAVREDKDIEAAFSGLSDFTDAYQAATVIDTPLFRRR